MTRAATRGLAVGLVISGEYFGWSYGWDKAGTLGFLVTSIGIAVMYLVNLVLSLFSVNTGLVAIGPSAGPLAWIVSAVAVALAVASLIMDFDYIEQGVRNQLPASESWRGAFGLTVTMVWLYTELLRVMSYFRN